MLNHSSIVSRVRNVAILTTALLLLVPLTAAAQTPVYVDVSQCRNIRVDLVRVACYDRLADMAMHKNGAPPATAPAQVPQTVPQGKYSEQLQEKNRKMREELARLRQENATSGKPSDAERMQQFGKPKPNPGRRIARNKNGEDVLYDRIQSLQHGPDGWLITLSSGQVWKELYNSPYNLEQGMEVKIYPGSLGSYHLTVRKLNGSIYVKRLR